MIPLEIQRTFTVASRRNILTFVVVLILALAAAGLEAVGVSLVFGFMKILMSPTALETFSMPTVLRQHLEVMTHREIVLTGAICIAVFYSIKNVFLTLNFLVSQKFLEIISVETAVRLLSSYLSAPFIVIQRRNSSELIQNIYLLSQSFSSAVIGPVISLISEILVIVAIVIVMFTANPKITAITMTIFCLTLLVFYGSLRRYYLSLSKVTTEGSRQVLQKAQETLGSLKEVKVLQREAVFLARFETARRLIANPRVLMAFVGQLPRFVTETMLVIMFSLVIGIVLELKLPADEVFPILGLYAMAGFRLLPSLNRILADLGKVKAGSIEIDRIFEDVNAVVSGNHYGILPKPAQSDRIQFQHHISFENVSFTYPDGEIALQNISFVIPKNHSIGIMGPSGAGKTTLIDILIGLISPTSGRVEIDGKELDTIIGPWRQSIGFVPQDLFIVDDTLRRNIAFGIPDEEINDQNIQDALDMAALTDVVASLPNGLNTILQEHGSRLSGGQRQRIGIARAMYHKPQVLILDEATSALDTETERDIITALKQLAGTITIFIIAHRPSMVESCDQIFFIKDAQMLAAGTIEELKKYYPEYADKIFHTGYMIADDVASDLS